MPAETVLLNGRFTTLDPALPEVTAVAIAEGRFTAVGDEREVLAQAEPAPSACSDRRQRRAPGQRPWI